MKYSFNNNNNNATNEPRKVTHPLNLMKTFVMSDPKQLRALLQCQTSLVYEAGFYTVNIQNVKSP